LDLNRWKGGFFNDRFICPWTIRSTIRMFKTVERDEILTRTIFYDYYTRDWDETLDECIVIEKDVIFTVTPPGDVLKGGLAKTDIKDWPRTILWRARADRRSYSMPCLDRAQDVALVPSSATV
jgi:hypothetical protein